MKDLLAIIEAIGSNIKLEVNGSDLQRFAEQLIEKARNELSDSINNTRTERYLTKAEVMDILRVCDTTLWKWNKNGYLKTVKMGGKVRYKMSDVEKIMKNE